MGRKRIRLNKVQCTVEYAIHPTTSTAADAPHVLLLHGHSSRMAEFDDLVPELVKQANIYTFDQPCCGKSTDVDAKRVRERFSAETEPALTYLRGVCSEFVRLVVQPHLACPASLRVAGGSLGGNLALWISERGYPWLKDAVVWSPGSAWHGDIFQAVGAGAALARAKEAWGNRRNEFLEGSYCKNVVDVLGIVGLTRPQAWYWYWDAWKGGPLDAKPTLATVDGTLVCDAGRYPHMTQTKADAITHSFTEIEEDYTARRAAWHWQVAGEQLRFSHQDTVQLPDGTRLPRVALAQNSIRFMAGEHDNHAPADLHGYTEELHDKAAQHVTAPLSVTWQSIAGSGHSIHNEKPVLLAQILAGKIDA